MANTSSLAIFWYLFYRYVKIIGESVGHCLTVRLHKKVTWGDDSL